MSEVPGPERRIKRFSKVFNSPLPQVYSWCTDFTEDDLELMGLPGDRRMLEKTPRRCVSADIYNDADGKQRVAVDVISLRPPNSWHLDKFTETGNESVDYKLTSLGKDKTRLDMVFRNGLGHSEMVWFNELWDKFAVAVEKEYRSRKK